MSIERPVITFSAGDPPLADLTVRGIGSVHVDDGVLRVARSVLRSEVDVAYSGDLRGTGFNTILSDDTGKVVLGPRFVSFLGWPFSAQLSPGRIADTLGLCRYVRVEPGFPTENIPSDKESPQWSWAMARATTATRRMLFSREPCQDINSAPVMPRFAQVLFAGKAEGFLGVMPGIAEEMLCALDSGLAIYIVGAFGGAASLLAKAITTPELPEAFTFEHHHSNAAFVRMREGAENEGAGDVPAGSFQRLQDAIREVRSDFGLLNNGLSREENIELMLTNDIGKVAKRILMGMQRILPEVKC